jgi:hypothetical protein
MGQFVEAAEEDSRRLGLSIEDVAAADEARQRLAVVVSKTRSTQGTSVDAVVKRDVRKAAEAIFRPLAMRVKNDPDVDPGIKTGLGLRVPPEDGTGRGSRVGPPTSVPALLCAEPLAGGHRLRYVDERTPDTSALPREASGLLLFAHFGDRGDVTPTDDPERASLLRGYTRTPLRTELPLDARGRVVTYFGRWQGKHGELGPWSRPR